MHRSSATLALLLLASAPASAEQPDWHCTKATHVYCDAAGACVSSVVEPFVLILDWAQGQVELCQGEFCQSGVFAASPEHNLGAVATLLFGMATLENHPLPANYAGRDHALAIDTALRAISLGRIEPSGLDLLQITGCTPDS